MVSECTICYDNFNEYKCTKCENECCLVCLTKWLKTNNLQCIHCKEAIEPDSIDRELYCTLRKKQLLKQDSIHNLATMRSIEFDKFKENKNDEISNVYIEHAHKKNIIICKIRNFRYSTNCRPIIDVINEYESLISELSANDVDLNDKIEDIEMDIEMYENDLRSLNKSYVCACSSNDCNMLLATKHLSTDETHFECKLCNKNTCSQCQTNYDINHECNKELLKSISIMNDSTKPCPKCHSRITKVAGCFTSSTVIPTFDGLIKRVNEIKVGDLLIGDDYQPRIVSDIITGTAELFRIHNEWADRSHNYYDVNLTHMLALKDASGKSIMINVKTYMEMDLELYGYDKYDTRCLIRIEQLNIIGRYWGFKIHGDRKFQLIDGTIVSNCSQMFCSQCYTTFDWETLKINKGEIHNPHHEEWLTMNTMNRTNIKLGKYEKVASGISDNVFAKKLKEYFDIAKKLEKQIINVSNIDDNDRKRFLKNEISEKEYANILFTNDVKSNIQNENRIIYIDFIETVKHACINHNYNQLKESVKKCIDKLTNIEKKYMTKANSIKVKLLNL
jgi:hypothetical protein